MSRTYHHGERRIRVQGIRKDPPDLRRLARALIELAKLQAEAEAQAEQEQRDRKSAPRQRSTKHEPPTKPDHGGAA
jgi:hypothetical protein